MSILTQRMQTSAKLVEGLIKELLVPTEPAPEEKKRIFAANAAKLEALSPMAVLLRGYSAAFTQGGKLISSVEDAAVGDKIALSVSDGTIYTEVIGKETKNHGNLS